ncbi:hypothetical protein MKL09_17945 [Methylobacterium sp. J-048]|uniref:hypothetical protein n=1 Tax=Methylobacterium sp. J-048 TaxID=2836635 RepID=UPI001FBAEF46|nr:hypothetical protein [Methylobacterium sp. J-048]MCJ2058425.1 hypothetical protein [Methylobacterium sp. J-048]
MKGFSRDPIYQGIPFRLAEDDAGRCPGVGRAQGGLRAAIAQGSPGEGTKPFDVAERGCPSADRATDIERLFYCCSGHWLNPGLHVAACPRMRQEMAMLNRLGNSDAEQ